MKNVLHKNIFNRGKLNKNIKSFILISLVSGFLISSRAVANQEYIIYSDFNATQLAVTVGASASNFKQGPIDFCKKNKLSCRPFLSYDEGQIAFNLNASWLAEAQIVSTPIKIEQMVALAKKGSFKNLKVDAFDLNYKSSLKLGTATDDFNQWGLNNQGLPQPLDLEPLKAFSIQARFGQDIQVPQKQSLKHLNKVIVAVFDTGIDINHPQLAGIIKKNITECQALEKYKICLGKSPQAECDSIWFNLKNPEVDLDKNGYPLDCNGWSVVGGINPEGIRGHFNVQDQLGHGTHVAGIIGAQKLSPLNGGIQGVSSHIELLPIQVINEAPSEPIKPLSLNSGVVLIRSSKLKSQEQLSLDPHEAKLPRGRFLADMVARGVLYALASGAKVFNFSLGWPQNQDSEFLRQLIAYAQSQGVIVVAASGNDSTRALLRPCAYSGVLCVGASRPDGAIAHFSNYGAGVDLLAPGVHILSTWPMGLRAKRFRNQSGYEYLSGTSQAAPFVAGVAADMMAQGYSSDQVKSFLMASAQKPLSPLPLKEGLSHESSPRFFDPSENIKTHYVSFGNINWQKAQSISKEFKLLGLANKEKIIVPIDFQNHEVQFSLPLVNLSLQASKIDDWDFSVKVVQSNHPFQKTILTDVWPEVVSAVISDSSGLPWQSFETKNINVVLKLPKELEALKKMPGEITLFVDVKNKSLGMKGLTHNQFYPQIEFIRPINQLLASKSADHIKINQTINPNSRLLPIDQIFDNNKYDRDYLGIEQGLKKQTLFILKFNDQSYNKYDLSGFDYTKEDLLESREQYLARGDFNGDGKSDYLLGYYTEKQDELPLQKFYLFGSEGQILNKWVYSNPKAIMPYEVSWYRLPSGMMRPAWVGPGLLPNKTRGVRDYWENPDDQEPEKVRLYYLDHNFELGAISPEESEYFVDLIFDEKNMNDGLELIIAQQGGSSYRPEFNYSFFSARFDGKNIIKKKNILSARFHNLLETQYGPLTNLDTQLGTNNRGLYWFGFHSLRNLQISLLDSAAPLRLDSDVLKPRQLDFDGALFVRAAFMGQKTKGAFVFTNSEIQYHDLVLDKTSSTSLERYTFFPSRLMTNLYFPIAIRNGSNSEMIPGLFTTEGSNLHQSLQIVVPIFANDNSEFELLAPAWFKIQAQGDKQGGSCLSLETPLPLKQGGVAMDYLCGNQILRWPLAF